MQARRLMAEHRRKQRERKRRTRALIQMGGVAARYGFSDTAQLEAVLSQLVRSRRGPAFLHQLGVSPTHAWEEAGQERE